MPRGRRKDAGSGGGAPAWMVTYGDLMSLLLTFFVLLLSFSTIEEQKFRHAISSLQGALGLMPHNLTAIETPRPPQEIGGRRPTRQRVEQMARQLMRSLQVRGMEDLVQVEMDERGVLKINLPSQILFETGLATLRSEAEPMLTEVADALGGLEEAQIEVHGHTDSVPISPGGQYRDNLDLSFDRARSVGHFIGGRGNIPMARMELVAHGESKPIASNETEEGRQVNRRVEIYVRGQIGEEVLESLGVQTEQAPAAPPRTDRLVPIEVPRR